MKQAVWGLAVAVLVMAGPARAQPTPPIVAVFDVQMKGVKFPGEVSDRLTDFLTLRLGASGRFKVVPRDQLKLRLVEEKRSSYRECFDQACQIDLGKAVAAQKGIATVVVKVGSRCDVTLNVFDLRVEASEGGGSARGTCDEDGIVSAMDQVIAQIAGEPERSRATIPPHSAAPGAQPAAAFVPPPPDVEDAGPRVRKGPVTASLGDLTVSARTASGVPVRLELKDPSGKAVASGSPFKDPQARIGSWTVTARATGHEEATQSFVVPPDEPMLVKLELKPLGALKITGEPSGAAVRVTGPGGFRDEGGLPWEAERLRSGTYEVEVNRDGYTRQSRSVQVEPGGVASVAIRLEKSGAGKHRTRADFSDDATYAAYVKATLRNGMRVRAIRDYEKVRRGMLGTFWGEHELDKNPPCFVVWDKDIDSGSSYPAPAPKGLEKHAYWVEWEMVEILE